MKFLDWLLGKREAEFRFIGHVKREDGEEPYLTIYVEDRFFAIETRRGETIRVDRKCLPYLLPILEKAKMDA